MILEALDISSLALEREGFGEGGVPADIQLLRIELPGVQSLWKQTSVAQPLTQVVAFYEPRFSARR